MSFIRNTKWPDLPGVSVRVEGLLPVVHQCRIQLRREEKVSVLLLPRGMFSVFSMQTGGADADVIAQATGRVVVNHSVATGSLVDRQRLAVHFGRLEIGADSMDWPDLPEVNGFFRATHDRVAEYGLRLGAEHILISITRDSLAFVGWVWLSTPVRSPLLLRAVGRVVIAHHGESTRRFHNTPSR